mgnify:CR=1 FL=1
MFSEKDFGPGEHEEELSLCRRAVELDPGRQQHLVPALERVRAHLEQARLDRAIWTDGRVCAPGSIGACL